MQKKTPYISSSNFNINNTAACTLKEYITWLMKLRGSTTAHTYIFDNLDSVRYNADHSHAQTVSL